MKGLLIVALALLTGYAQADTSPLTAVQIRLEAGTTAERKTRHVLCKVDKNYFTVPRSMLKRRVTITARNGVTINFPWQANQCEDTKVWAP